MSGGFLFLQNLHRRADLIPEYDRLVLQGHSNSHQRMSSLFPMFPSYPKLFLLFPVFPIVSKNDRLVLHVSKVVLQGHSFFTGSVSSTGVKKN